MNDASPPTADPSEQPAQEQPAQEQPAQEQPAQEQPAQEQPAHAKALMRLEEEVTHAARELRRLQKENAALKAHVEELKTHPGLAHDGTLVPFDDQPGALRRQVEHFIEALDRHLAQSSSG